MKDDKKPFDMTEEASLRNDLRATEEARRAESDDASPGGGLTDMPGDQAFGENKVSTSLDDDD
ncbi:MAG: hypothetical protein JWP27_1609 [Flaviaesturariibacter sp.]|nr:hypothetical protein [Flaviaesturariibacter sp.]